MPHFKKIYSGIRKVTRNDKNPLIYLPKDLMGYVGKHVFVIVYEVIDDEGEV